MRFVILDTYYQPVVDYVYGKYSTLFQKSYRTQQNHLLAQKFGTADFYSRNLKKLGHRAKDIILNMPGSEHRWSEEIEKFNPDIVYCQNLSVPGSKLLKEIFPRPRLIVGQIASPTVFDKEYLSGFDLIVTSFPHYVERYRKLGIACEYLPLAFEDALLGKLPSAKKRHDVVFVGNNFPHHKSAIPIFNHLAKNARFDIWGLGWEGFAGNYHLEPAWGLPMFKIYRQAKIVVNRHIDAAENFANNMRLFEATGVGTMLITDYKDNLNDLFVVGKEIETYKTKEELVDKAKFYLQNEKARERIAQAGQQRTLKSHAYRQRMKELLGIIKRYV